MKISKNILLLFLLLSTGISATAGDAARLFVFRGDTATADTTDPGIPKFKLDTTEVPRLGADNVLDTNEVPKATPTVLESIEDGEHGEEVSLEDWDSNSVHTEKFDVLQFNDTAHLHLVGSYTCGYNHPIAGHKTSDFGFRRYRYHFGVDIDLETGDSVNCVFDGKVRIAQFSKSYGNIIVVRHNNGLETYYAHLSKLMVKPGQDITAGQVLGLGGNTGRSRGSHLHFEVRYKGQPINPNSIIDFENHQLRVNEYNLSKADFKYLTETYKVTTRSRKGKRRTSYYTPGGPKMATPEAKAAMAGVSAPKIEPSATCAVPKTVKTTTTPAKETKTTVTPKTTAPKTTAKTPATPAKPGQAVYHTIRSGDTLYALALKHKTTVAKICALNGIKPTTTLAIGRKIRIK